MTKQILKNFFAFTLVFVMAFSMFAFASDTLASGVGQGTGYTTKSGAADNTVWGDHAGTIQNQTGFGNDDPRSIAANIINVILGFLGILAVVLILFGGFKWMTAAGNEDKVGEAKKLLVAGVIGLIIILASYSLASFVLDAVFRTTGSI